MRATWGIGRGALAVLAAASLIGAAACGVDSRVERQARAEAEAGGAGDGAGPVAAEFAWPRSDGTRPVAVLEVADLGEIHIALYPELAPRTVEAFIARAEDDFYADTTFHRVIPGFMIQGGDPNTKDDDPSNDGYGGPPYTLPDERSDAPHTRGTVSMANKGQPNSGGSQFFIVHADAPHLDGGYSVFGRVVAGMDVVDDITRAEIDTAGRWGPQNRPLRDIRVKKVRIEQQPDDFESSRHAGR